VAASIHTPEDFGQGASAAFDLITPSSQGWLMVLWSAAARRRFGPRRLDAAF